ncbi:MAG: deoxyribose-phosphate aldolase [Erysipelotrichaceae bacterium]|nr:deoxyribose-phosphate aldolase [Erysipelotrichaceae bacterium]MBR2745996.1 deoxyribose-phosphate aldolase [Erysipelotrichaceae bacterium]
MISKKELAKMVDHTNLKPYATAADMKKLCDEAIENGFGMVAINPAQVKRCKEYLKGTGVHVGAAIGFPLGQTTIEVKVYETEDAIKNGADEIDYVINITELKEKNYEYIEEEMQEIVDVCRKNNVISKVIFENCFLTKEEIRKMSEIALKVRPDFVKTSTGWGTSGAKLEDIAIMKEVLHGKVQIKAASGIKTFQQAKTFVEAGCTRLGTSSGIAIIEGYEE